MNKNQLYYQLKSKLHDLSHNKRPVLYIIFDITAHLWRKITIHYQLATLLFVVVSVFLHVNSWF